jgi:hypothetical protein
MENESTTENLNHFNMWIAKPIYESLPYFYLLAGIISLGLSMYLNYWYMPTICFVVGLGCLVAGLVVLLTAGPVNDRITRTGLTGHNSRLRFVDGRILIVVIVQLVVQLAVD